MDPYKAGLAGRKPHRRLRTVEFKLRLADPLHQPFWGLHASGWDDNKRTALWHYHEHFEPALDEEKGYGVADAIHHIALVAIQDHPTRLEQVEFALRGGVAWAQDPLWGENES